MRHVQSTRWACACLLTLGCVVAPRPALAGIVTTALKHTGDLLPGSSTRTFSTFDKPAFDGTNTVWYSTGSDGRRGLYLYNGTSTVKVADTNTVIPGSTNDKFSDFQEPSIDAGRVAFEAWGGGKNGIFVYNPPSPIATLIRTPAPIPASGASTVIPSVSVNGASAAGGKTVFWARGNTGAQSIGLHNGTSALALAMTNFVAPQSGGKRWSSFRNVPSFDGVRTAFTGSFPGGQGVYYHNGTTRFRIADTSINPYGTGNPNDVFSFFDHPAIDGTSAAFGAATVGGTKGIFHWNGTGVAPLVDTSTAIPTVGGTFTGFGDVLSYDDGNTLFIGKGAGGFNGLYLFDGAHLTLNPVTWTGSALDGLTVASLSLWNDALQGNSGVFAAGFTNGTQAVYRFDYSYDGGGPVMLQLDYQGTGGPANPEPGTIAVLGAGLAVLARRRRR